MLHHDSQDSPEEPAMSLDHCRLAHRHQHHPMHGGSVARAPPHRPQRRICTQAHLGSRLLPQAPHRRADPHHALRCRAELVAGVAAPHRHRIVGTRHRRRHREGRGVPSGLCPTVTSGGGWGGERVREGPWRRRCRRPPCRLG
jgi:hypothetical protein